MSTKRYYVFIGQNASTGKPNRITGHYSFWGHYKVFPTLKERNDYVANWWSNNPSEWIVKCSLKTGRQYSLGCSMREYLEHMQYVEDCYTILNGEH